MTTIERDDGQDQEEEGVQVKPFAATLQELSAGAIHDELSAGLQELIQRCKETGKKGAITLKVSVAPQKDDETVQIAAETKLAAPRHEPKPTVFYYDEHGNLHRSNPKQMQIGPLREVPVPARSPRELKENAS